MKRDLDSMLKSADPAEGDPGLSRIEAARMRSVIAEEAGREAAGPMWIPFLAGGAVAAVVLIFILFGPLPRQGPPPRDMVSPELHGAAGPVRTAADHLRSQGSRPGTRPPRKILFTTRSGTRVIWTLDPDFDV